MLEAFAIAFLWLLFQCISEPCYLHLHGRSAAAATFAFRAGWMFILFAGDKYVRIALLAMTFFALFFVNWENNISSAATSRAMSILRETRGRIETEYGHKVNVGYPATATFAPEGAAKKLYRFEYVPLASHSGGSIDGYVLKARPQRYDCGVTRSFLVDRNGRFHITQEDREPTESDPILE
jgi:uncharacterized membrane protein